MELELFYNKELTYYFSKIICAFKPEESDGINGKILYEIEGEFYVLEVKDGKCNYCKTETAVENDTHITVSKKKFIEYMLGLLSLNNSFKDKDLKIEGDLDVAASMEFIFEHPLKAEIWFYLLENSIIIDEVKGVNHTFCFEIEKCKEQDSDGFEFIIENPIAYRYASINEKGCQITPTSISKPDVTISVKEEDIISFLNGEFSFYDAFLNDRIEIGGIKILATDFPRFFYPEVFPNKTIKNLTAENVFKVMHKMVDEIPKHMVGCIILFSITGTNRKNYFVNIQADTIKINKDNPDNRINTRIEMSEDIFLEICKDKIHFVDAYSEGEISVKGNNKLGMDFNNVLKARFNYGIEN